MRASPQISSRLLKAAALAVVACAWGAGPWAATAATGATLQVTARPGPHSSAPRGEAGLNGMPPAAAANNVKLISPELRADVMLARGEYAAALEAYQQLPQKSSAVWNKMGLAYHHLFALEEARKDYKEALRLDPHNANALNNLGAVYYAEHKYGKAERAYRHALKYSPGAAVIYSNLGTAYFSHGKYKQGMQAYHHAFAIDPSVFNPDPGLRVAEGSGTREQRIAMDYYLARTFAAAGKRREAMLYLRMAVNAGFHDRKRMMQDAEFAGLRATPEFQQLLMDRASK